MEKIVSIVLFIFFMKVVTGWHWNWERCDCCGRKWREIRKEKVRLAIKPKCKLTGEDTNVINVIRRVNKTLIQADFDEQAREFVAKAIASKSYEDVLTLCREYVEII